MSSPIEDDFDIDDAIDEILEEEILMGGDLYVEEEMLIKKLTRGSPNSMSNVRRRRYIYRNHVEAHNQLYADYFSSNPIYNEDMFRLRFRMRRHLFIRIQQKLTHHYEFFTQKADGLGKPGASPLQKCTAAMRALAYGASMDSLDEYARMGESTILSCVKKFANGVIECFGDEYLRKPTTHDLERLLHNGEERVFPGMLGSIDCMHWELDKCPVAWRGMYEGGHHGKATVVLEAVASFDTWIWHAFFGNDVNVIDKSPMFDDLLQGKAPEVHFNVNGEQFNMGYYLTIWIYLKWATFVKSVSHPRLQKHKVYAAEQESARKDVEQAFGILQSRFAIVRRPARFWGIETIGRVMRACIILHNMIVEDECTGYQQHLHQPHYDNIDGTSYQSSNTIITPPEYRHDRIQPFHEWLKKNVVIHDHIEHNRLKLALIEHVYRRYGLNYNNQ